MNHKAISIVGGPSSADQSSRSSLSSNLEKLKGLDFLAPDVGLNFRGSSAVKTFCGVFLSLASACVFIAAAVYISLGYLDTSQPVVLQDLSSTTTFPKINLMEEKRFAGLIFFTKGFPIPLNSVSSFVTVYSVLQTQQTVQTAGGGLALNMIIDTKPLIPCRNLSPEVQALIPKGDASQDQYLGTYALCPDYNLQDFHVYGKASDPMVRSFEIAIYPCSLGSGQCASQDDISQLSFTFAHSEPSFNMSNYENPICYAWNPNDFFHINIGALQSVTTQLMKTEVWNDGGLFSSVKMVAATFSQGYQSLVTRYRNPNTVQCTVFPLNETNCIPYIVLRTYSGGQVEKLTRSYKGAIETIGEIGGIRDIVFTAAFAIYWLFHSKLIRKTVVNMVYDLPEKKCLLLDDEHFPCGKQMIDLPIHTANSPFSGQQVNEANKHTNMQGNELEDGRDRGGSPQASPPRDKDILDQPGSALIELDYHTAMQAIEDTLDVVTLVRRIQWLETFADYVLHNTNSYNSFEGARLNSLASYLVAKTRLDLPTNDHQDNQHSKTATECNSPRNTPASENIGKTLGDEYQQFLKRVVSKNCTKSKLPSVKSTTSSSKEGEKLGVVVPIVPVSHTKAKLYRNFKVENLRPGKNLVQRGSILADRNQDANQTHTIIHQHG